MPQSQKQHIPCPQHSPWDGTLGRDNSSGRVSTARDICSLAPPQTENFARSYSGRELVSHTVFLPGCRKAGRKAGRHRGWSRKVERSPRSSPSVRSDEPSRHILSSQEAPFLSTFFAHSLSIPREERMAFARYLRGVSLRSL